MTFCAGRSVAANVQFVTDDLMPVAAPVTEISRTAISSHQSSYPSCMAASRCFCTEVISELYRTFSIAANGTAHVRGV